MLAIHQMFDLEKHPESEEKVDEGFGADLAYSIKKRMPFQRRVAPGSGVLPSKSKAVQSAVRVMNNRARI